MAQLVLIGRGDEEFIVIDDDDLDDAHLQEEYLTPGMEIREKVDLDEDMYAWPTGRLFEKRF